MTKLLLLSLVLLSGCSVMHNAKNELHKEVNGFRADFARVYLNKPTDVDLLLKGVPNARTSISKNEQ
jgi:hypothetical protein